MLQKIKENWDTYLALTYELFIDDMGEYLGALSGDSIGRYALKILIFLNTCCKRLGFILEKMFITFTKCSFIYEIGQYTLFKLINEPKTFISVIVWFNWLDLFLLKLIQISYLY